MDIASIVEKLVKKYKTSDPFELADYMNVNVYILPLHNEIKGIYQHFKRNKFIYISQALRHPEQRIVCGHELGHSVLHQCQNISFIQHKMFCVKNKFELEANLFAAELLISDEEVWEYSKIGMNMEQIAKIIGIPYELICIKYRKR